MAGKKKLGNQGPMLLGGLDLDDVDSLLDDGSSQSTAKRTPKESIRKFATATKSSLRDRVNAKSVLASFIRTALPDGYTRLLGLYDETAAGIQSVVDGVEETEFAALEKLAERFEDQLPKLKGKLPDAVYERIKAKLDDKKDDYKLRRQIGDAQAARKKGDYDEKGEDLSVSAMLDQMQLAEAQLDMDKASSDVEHNKLDYDVKRDGIRARLDKTRFDVLNRHLGMIADSTQRSTAYNDSVTYQFQKKSLELQMRSYLAQRSLIKLTNETLTLHKQAYTALVHNTGLPEFMKSSNAERTKFYVTEQMRNPFQNLVAKTASDAAANFLPTLFNNIGTKTAGTVRGAANVGQGGLGMMLKSLMQNPEESAGGLAGDQLASILHSSIIPSIARRVRPGMKTASDKLTGGADSRIAYVLDNMAALSQDFANDAKNSTGMKGQLQKMVKAFAPQFRVNDLAKTGTYQTINQAAQFNQMTQRSIVEIIPGYLARILQETRMIRTGDDTIGREVFDITRGQFTQERKSQDNLAKRIVGLGARRSVKWSVNSTVDKFTEEGGALSPEAKHALEERLLRDAMEGKHFDPVAYVRPDGYAPGTDPAVLNELSSFFKTQFKFGEDGKLSKSADNYAKRQDFSTSFNELRDTVRNPIAEIERVLGSGNTTQLRDLGIVHTVEGEDRINYAVLRDLYRDLGDPNASGEPPPVPSPTGPMLSKLRKRLRDGNDQIKARAGKVRARLGGIRDRAKGAMEDAPGASDIADAMSSKAAVVQQHAAAAASQVTDLMIAGRAGVVIKADEILSGELIDATTQKVISKVEDIKGEVIDITGRVRLTRAEVAQGLVNGEGRRFDLLKHLPNRIPPNVLSMINQGRHSIGNLITQENGAMSRVKDLYLEGANDPVIKAAGLRAGEYIDVATKKVLETIDDISGAVVRKDRPDEVLFTTEEAAERLVDNTGKRFKSSKILKYLAWATGKSLNITGGLISIGLAVARKTAMFIAKKVTGLDAYLPPGREPILTTTKLKRGEYYNEDGSVIKSFDDLRDGVYSADGNLLVDPEDIPNLINRDGTKHTAAKRRSAIRKLGKKIAGLPMRAAKGLGKMWWKGTKSYYKGMGRMIANKFGKSKAGAEAYNDNFITPTDSLLGQMINLLDRRLPKEDAKEGSWQQKLAESEAAVKAKKEGKQLAKPKKKEGGGLLAGLAKMLGGKKDEEEDGNDVNIDFGGGDDKGGDEAGEDGKKRKARKKPRGRMGRMWDKAKDSRVGKGIGRIGGSTAVRSLAGNGARMLGSTGLAAAASALGIDIAALTSGASALMGGVSLSGVGGAIGTGAAALGGGLATAGTAILGVLASPVVLGALAVGAAAGAGYWLWNRSSKVSGDFRELRLMQYGIDSTGDKLKVLELEAYLETFSEKGAEPRLNIKGTDPVKVFEILGIDADDHEAIVRMARWLELRFKPVFFTWLRAMHQLTPTGVAINELDDKLPDEAKYDFFNIVKTVPPGVYTQLINPLDEDPIEITPEDINAKVTELIDEWKDKAKAKDEQKTGDTTGAAAIVPPGGKPEEKKAADGTDKPKDAEKSSAWDSIKAGAKGMLGAIPGVAAIGGLISAVKEDWFGKLFSGASTVAKIVATPALLGGMVLKSAVSMVGVFKADKLTTLQAVRVRAYGRMQLDEKSISALFESEAELYKQVRYDTEGQAYYDGNLDQLIGTMANIFGVDVTDATSRKAQEFTAWILQRFIPTGLAYFAAVKQRGNAITPSRVETALDDDAKLSVANALMTASYEMNGENISVWKANTFFNNGTSGLDALKAAAEKELTVLKEAAAKAKLASPGTSVKEQENQEKSQARTTAEKIMDGVSSFGNSLKEKFSSFADGVKESFGGAVNSVKDFLGLGPGGDNAQKPAPSAYNTAYTPGGTLEQKGSTYTSFAEGNGGAWNTIPLPKSNKSREAAMETLRAIQAMTGVDAELLATFASMESNFDYTVKAGTSSATGWFQFIDKTWDGMLKDHASKYGIPPDNKDRYLRKDPRINGLMGAEFLKGNYKILAKALGRAPTDTDLYFAHFLGPVTAAGFLKRDRNAIAASFYPDQAGANRSIFYKSTGQPRTIGEVYEIFDGKVRKHRKGGSSTDVGKATTAVDPQKAADEQAKAVQAGADIKPPADPVTGEVGTNPTGGNPNDSLTMTADKAAAPMRMGDPSQAGGGGGTAPTAGTSPTVGSGQQMPERQAALDDAMQKAAAGDKARAAENQEKQALSASSVNFLQEQLTTQQEMRDLLKTIAAKMGSPVAAAPAPAPAPSSKSGNDMGNQQAQAGRHPGNAPTPISFSR